MDRAGAAGPAEERAQRAQAQQKRAQQKRAQQVGIASAIGGLAGAAWMGAAEALARARQRPGEIPALWSRILMSGALAAPFGWMSERFLGAGPVPVATAAGAAAGALGLR